MQRVIRMPHLIRDVAEEVLKDLLLPNVIRLETGEEPERFFDSGQENASSLKDEAEGYEKSLLLKVINPGAGEDHQVFE